MLAKNVPKKTLSITQDCILFMKIKSVSGIVVSVPYRIVTIVLKVFKLEFFYLSLLITKDYYVGGHTHQKSISTYLPSANECLKET